MSDHLVRCLPSLTMSGGDQTLRMSIDDRAVGVKLRISQLNERLASGLPDRALDLLEIAALVYGADAACSRGGTTDESMGRRWHRNFQIEITVRDTAFWQLDSTKHALEETLMFLSGDRFDFTFTQKREPEAERTRFFRFDKESSWRATRVLMFSGGLDSFAGALEEIAEHGQRVALVSHFSASKIAPAQRNLLDALNKRFGQASNYHIPVRVQMTGQGLREGTHRSRSFLFAVLGAITTRAFELDRVSFYENGVVSLNLPPVGNVLGTRATRTTHPQTLSRFTGFLSLVFDAPIRVDNPYFWRTKKDVVETISRLQLSDQIALTRSCADVHNQTVQHPHCGRCSQCIDRRFAILAAGLEGFDPGEAYKVDLMRDPRKTVIDREVALSYIRNAQAYEHMGPQDLERLFPAVLNAVNHLDNPPGVALDMIAKLLRRHGAGVAGVMRETLRTRDPAQFPPDSLPNLHGEMQRAVALPEFVPKFTVLETRDTVLTVKIDKVSGRIEIADRISFQRTATAQLMMVLAQEWLNATGKGLAPLDHPFMQAKELMRRLGLESDETLRRRISRARKDLARRFASTGLENTYPDDLIENHPWQGYRLAPDRVIVQQLAPSR